MGGICQSCNGTGDQKQFTVATLNFSGIMNSPLEFYCRQHQQKLETMSQEFAKLIPVYYEDFNKDKFKWEIGKIDVKIRKGRYSPMFEPQIGIQNNKFISRKRYEELWNESFERECRKQKFSCDKKQKDNARNFDLIVFHACLKLVFPTDKINTIDDAIHLETSKYLNVMKPLYQLSYLNEEKKSDVLMRNLYRIDPQIIFLQQFSKQLKKEITDVRTHQIRTDAGNDVMIAVKSKFFKNISKIEDIAKDYAEDSQKWPKGTCILIVDKLILIGVHLSSKKQKNGPQIQLLKTSLISLKAKVPNYDIIVGGDLNSFMNPFEAYNMYPTKPSEYTTIKKRTMVQCQYNKGDVKVEESKDKIISNLPMSKQAIKLISGKVADEKDQLPQDSHPFDHFVVMATLKQINQK